MLESLIFRHFLLLFFSGLEIRIRHRHFILQSLSSLLLYLPHVKQKTGTNCTNLLYNLYRVAPPFHILLVLNLLSLSPVTINYYKRNKPLLFYTYIKSHTTSCTVEISLIFPTLLPQNIRPFSTSPRTAATSALVMQ